MQAAAVCMLLQLPSMLSQRLLTGHTRHHCGTCMCITYTGCTLSIIASALHFCMHRTNLSNRYQYLRTRASAVIDFLRSGTVTKSTPALSEKLCSLFKDGIYIAKRSIEYGHNDAEKGKALAQGCASLHCLKCCSTCCTPAPVSLHPLHACVMIEGLLHDSIANLW